MKILFIVVAEYASPFTSCCGGNVRSNLMLRACAECGDVDVISFCSDSEPDRNGYHVIYQKHTPVSTTSNGGRMKKFRHLLTPWNPETLFDVNPEYEAVIDEFCKRNEYDYIFVRYLECAVACGLLKYARKLIIDFDDNPCDRAIIYAKIGSRTVRNRLYHRIFCFSMKVGFNVACRKCGIAFLSNIDDCTTSNRVFLPNAPLSYDYDSRDAIKGQPVDGRILVVGNMNYPPNKHGVIHFLDKVYPLIVQRYPEVTLHIVGSIPDDNLKNNWESSRGVKVMGFVPDIHDEYSRSQVAIVPIYYGAGTCIKVLEAMRMKRPCVVSARGFRGYASFFKDKEDCLLADDDKQFAEHVISILENPQIGQRLAESAYEKQQRYFSEEKFKDTVYSCLKPNGGR